MMIVLGFLIKIVNSLVLLVIVPSVQMCIVVKVDHVMDINLPQIGGAKGNRSMVTNGI